MLLSAPLETLVSGGVFLRDLKENRRILPIPISPCSIAYTVIYYTKIYHA